MKIKALFFYPLNGVDEKAFKNRSMGYSKGDYKLKSPFHNLYYVHHAKRYIFSHTLISIFS